MTIRTSLRGSLDESRRTLDAFLADARALEAVEAFAGRVLATVRGGGRLLVCGNGGSMSDAIHFASEWSGRFRGDRAPVSAIALSDPATLTCIANDYGFDQVFARQVEAHGRKGDLVVALSTSGDSPNVVAAAQTARRLGLGIVGLLGRGGGKLAAEVDVAIVVPSARTADRIQEVHIQILHAVTEAVERELFPENYTSRPAGAADSIPWSEDD